MGLQFVILYVRNFIFGKWKCSTNVLYSLSIAWKCHILGRYFREYFFEILIIFFSQTIRAATKIKYIPFNEQF